MKKQSNKKLLILLILCMGIGFAFLTSTLTINGNTIVSGNKWSVYFNNVQITEGSVEASVIPITAGTTTTSIYYTVLLDKPGDFYEFTVDAVNAGTIDAMIESIAMSSLDEDAAKYLNYTATYEDGTALAKNDVLEAKDTIIYKVRVEYKKDISASDLSNIDVNLNLSFEVNYVQSNKSHIDKITYGEFFYFDYTGEEQEFTVPETGEYKLELWGAQGGDASSVYTGGYGAYSVGTISLEKDTTLYINVGQSGTSCSSNCTTAFNSTTYNGGGAGGGSSTSTIKPTSGGGATHIATTSGLLSTLSENTDSILIVAGGGGGAVIGNDNATKGGNAGGIQGGSFTNTGTNYSLPTGGTQTSGGTGKVNGSFGKGGNGNSWSGGGGSGWYGGGGGHGTGGGGGSSFIGNTLLTDKSMYCYICKESLDEATKTISTINVSEEPIGQYAKQGNGYVRIMKIKDINFYNFKRNGQSVDIKDIKFDPTKEELSFVTSLSNTTDYAEFTFEIENTTEKDYYISKLIMSNYDDSKINYSITYSDGTSVETKSILPTKAKEMVTVRLELLDDSYSMDETKFSLKIKFDEKKTNESYTSDIWRFDYTSGEQTFTVPQSGIYKLEVWGAQGGSSSSDYIGGYGAYSVGVIDLIKDTNLYINVGQAGTNCSTNCSYKYNVKTYNGGGAGGGSSTSTIKPSSGGGATHIALVSGVLSTLSSHINDDQILIVAGGGGGAVIGDNNKTQGGSAGGIKGSSFTNTGANYTLPTGGTQTSGGTGTIKGTFGAGGNGSSWSGGGGAGWYGGGGGYGNGGAGGSSYIANSNLDEKAMYCYKCTESSEESTKTISTVNVSKNPVSEYAKIGNGYVRITYIGE